MELKQLKDFYTIAQCENLTKAAQILHTSQPSLSRSLRSLEEELGASLFDRIGRNIVLNETGRFALEKISITLHSIDAIKNDVDQYIHDDNLCVDIYTPVPMGDFRSIIVGFKRKYPKIRLRIASWNSKALENIQPDITFFASPIVHKEPNYLMLGEEDIVIAASKANSIADNNSVALKDLSKKYFIRTLSDSPFYTLTSSMFLEAGFKPKTIAEDQDYQRILTYVAYDFGIALAPAITWLGNWHEQIIQIPISDIHRKRYLYLKWPENSILSWATLRFRDYLIDHFNNTYGFNCCL